MDFTFPEIVPRSFESDLQLAVSSNTISMLRAGSSSAPETGSCRASVSRNGSFRAGGVDGSPNPPSSGAERG
jgi:hypothetical protein